MSKLFSLDGKVAIVTGSSRGIGRSIAEQMSALGAKIVVSSRKLDMCQEVVDGIAAKGGEAIAVACNISRKDECQALVDATIAKWGRLDSFVANAAVNPVYGPMSGLSDEAFDKVMTSNVQSAIWFANMSMPKMVDVGGGSFTIISSIGGLKGSATLGIYGISKSADFGVARALAVEWGPKNIRVNAVAPGLVKTDFARALWENPKLRDDRESRTPLRRLGDPDDIGGVAAFLATPAAAFITGQVIVADGGVTIT
ncbi:MAG TPA: SDR family oxidoreductase [Hyphomicrobiaceae bacterium]|nr:SDR family oxidoreductase [Hyphomicrobiaceae bacterium]